MKKRLFTGIALILAVTLLAAGCGAKVVATVNGEKITETELNRRMEQVAAMYGYNLDTEEGKSIGEYLKEYILESLIEERVVLQEAERLNIKVSKEEVNGELNEIKAQFISDDEYKLFLSERKFTEKDLKTYVEQQLILTKLFDEITKDITTTDRDAKKYYDENLPEFYEAEQIRARNIVVNTEEEAKAIIERLDKGEDFAQLAVELSIDPTAKENQGDIGYFDQDAPLVDEFKEAAFKLKVGEYTKTPVQSVYGYHIIKVEDRKSAHQRSFEEVKEELEQRFILEAKNEKFSNYIDELLEKAVIEKTAAEKKAEPALEEGGESSDEADAGAEGNSDGAAQ